MFITTMLRRLRGTILRAAVRRRPAVAAGLSLLAGSGIVLLGDHAWERWWTEGLAAIGGASGAALVLAGLMGRRPDWIEPPARREADEAEARPQERR